MPKRALSITLEADNVTWLKGRAGAAGVRSVSELLDQLVTAARESGGAGHTTSVVGTIDIDPRDPLLEHADEAVGALFDASLSRPLMIKETPAQYKIQRHRKRRRG
jgi:hypothetical protein